MDPRARWLFLCVMVLVAGIVGAGVVAGEEIAALVGVFGSLALAAVAFATRPAARPDLPAADDPAAVLQQRLVRGEITTDEFLERESALRDVQALGRPGGR